MGLPVVRTRTRTPATPPGKKFVHPAPGFQLTASGALSAVFDRVGKQVCQHLADKPKIRRNKAGLGGQGRRTGGDADVAVGKVRQVALKLRADNLGANVQARAAQHIVTFVKVSLAQQGFQKHGAEAKVHLQSAQAFAHGCVQAHQLRPAGGFLMLGAGLAQGFDLFFQTVEHELELQIGRNDVVPDVVGELADKQNMPAVAFGQ